MIRNIFKATVFPALFALFLLTISACSNPNSTPPEKENLPPTATGSKVSSSYSTGTIVGEQINFSGQSSTDADGTIVYWAWEFGDGETGTGSSVNHIYRFAGTYDVTLSVTDDSGASDLCIFSVDTVKLPLFAPQADFSISPSNGTCWRGYPLQCYFQ